MVRWFAFCVVLTVMSGRLTLYAQAPQAQPAQSATFRYWTTSWSFERIDLEDLSAKLKSIGFELPVKMTGTASVNFDVSVPLNGLKDPRAYQFRGSLSSQQFQADNLRLENFAANLNYSEGILRLTDLRGNQGSGDFSGTATADVAGKGPFAAKLEVKQISMGPIADLLAKFGVVNQGRPAKGTVSGDVELSGTLGKIRDIAAWKADGSLQLGNLAIGVSHPYSATIDKLSLRDGHLQVPEFEVRSSAVPEFYFNCDADLYLTDSQKFALALEANDIPAGDVLGLYFASPESIVSGKIDLQGNVCGELNPPNKPAPDIEVKIAFASPAIRVFGVDLGLLEHQLTLTSDEINLRPLRTTSQRLIIESVQASYGIKQDDFQLSRLDAKLFGGTITGRGGISQLADGVHQLNIDWKEINPRVQLPLGLKENPILSATSTGMLRWAVPADKVEFPAFHRVDANINFDPLKLGVELLGSLAVELQIAETGLSFEGNGEAFDGRVEVRSTSPLDPNVRWSDVPKIITGGQVLFADVQIGQVIGAIASTNQRNFSGTVSGNSDWTLSENGSATSRSKFAIRDLGVSRQSLSRLLNVDVETEGAEVRINSLTGAYAGGQIQASGQWSLQSGARAIDARITHADGDRFLLPIHELADKWVGGKVSARATIRGYGRGVLDDLRIRGTGRLTDGTTFNMPVGDARTPFRVLVKLDPLAWQVDFPSVRSDLAHGQVNGELHFNSPGAGRRSFNMDSRWRLNHVDFEELLHTYIGTSTLGQGLVTGRFNLTGRNIRSLDDLSGGFQLTLGGTDVTAVPGLPTTSNLLGAASLVNTTFSDGVVSGRITRGAVGIDHLVLLSNRLKVISTGRVGIADGRLDMTTIATTGNFRGQAQLLQEFAPRALISFSPVNSLNEWISDRTVVVDTIGTLRRPIVRLRPAETLQANLREFVIQQLRGRLLFESSILANEW